MRNTCFILPLFVPLTVGLFAQVGDPIRVWPGEAPDEPVGIEAKKAKAVTGSDGVIRIPYVDIPELHHFPAPPDKATGTCIIVCPGGGYGKLAWNKEGTEVATWLNTLGVEAVVLKYRVPRRNRMSRRSSAVGCGLLLPIESRSFNGLEEEEKRYLSKSDLELEFGRSTSASASAFY